MAHSKPARRPPAGPRPRRAVPLSLTVDRLAWGGKAVGRHEGKVVFVSKAVPGDHLLVAVDREKSRYAEGHVQAVLRPSPDRVDPRCKFFGHCGGCQWLSVRYPRQLAEKEALLKSALRAHLDGVQVDPIVPCDPPVGYRHRGDFHVVRSGGEARVGFFQEESHRVINLDVCLLFDQAFNHVYGALRHALKGDAAARGLERLTLARSEAGESYVLHCQLGPEGAPDDAGRLARVGQDAGCSGVLVTPAKDPGRALALEGVSWVRYGLSRPGLAGPDLEIRCDVRSFTQAHYGMNRRMVATALEWLRVARHERVLDLCAGSGNFTLPLACSCTEVVAVEDSAFAHADSKANAERNGLFNVRNIRGDAADWVTKMAAASERFDAVLLDPPRSGAKGYAERLGLLSPQRILYVSCNLPALDRDLSGFRAHGYRPVRLQAWDLFPQTYGVETLALLQKA